MSSINPDNKCAHLIKNVEYREDSLVYMMNMQRNLQEFIAKKKGGLLPGGSDFVEQINMSIYYWGCTTVEFFEMGEKLNDCEWYLDKLTPEDKLEIQYEYIDMWHFLMNQFLYSGITELDIPETLGYFFSVNNETEDLLDLTTDMWTSLSYLVGQYYNNLPFKKWKKYTPESWSNVDRAEQLRLMEGILKVFIRIGISLDIDKEHFYNLYVSKNEENIARQNEGGVYFNG